MASFRTLAIAAGAGLASALLFAASARGGPAALLVIAATPLPVMIAALGFSQSSGLVAAAVASAVVAVLLGPLAGAFFGVLITFPAWWLAYLVLLARPAASPAAGPPTLVWYPVGRIVVWGALLMAAVVLAFGAATLLHYGGYHATVAALAAHLKAALADVEAERSLADQAGIAASLMPPILAGLLFFMLMVDLWLAGRVVQGSGLLTRPWPALPENLRLPRAAAILLIAAAVAGLVGGVVGVASGVVAAPLGVAFMLQGLAAAHALTRGLAARRLILCAVYFVVLSLVPSAMALAVLGLVDCLLPLRRREVATSSPN
jgi:hypothetical protein